MKEKQMRKALEYICLASALTLIGYTFYVERQVIAATEHVKAATTRPPYHPRIKAELD